MVVGDVVFSNGVFMHKDEARVSPFDRGFLMAHAAYEVTAVYKGNLLDFTPHIARLMRTLAGIEIPSPYSEEEWRALHRDLLSRNDIQEGLVYLQVTAGAYGFRDFAGPEEIKPSVFMYAAHKPLIGDIAEHGIAAITVPDTRWQRRDLKTTQLLSQGLAYRAAREAGAGMAIMHEEGIVTEAASANVWIVGADGRAKTRALSHKILGGITRAAVDALMGDIIEETFMVDEMLAAREVFTTSAGTLIAPIIEIDGKAIGDGKPGPITREVQALYYGGMGVNLREVAPWCVSKD